ncbi:SpoIIE family protein phosphatase [Leptospira idonii]|uniref:Fused response regulator/phosphatase n=1 Tax=Leptospira idonii TaxID=1193500 RepID=A0A4R9M4L6_9LEPT|nr:SpoIIE family protein phosphatase [Leptospira idonii]TGN19688.1 fused response regulator/phosphatase [Leptospira idonii]
MNHSESKILVVEDNALNRRMIVHILRKNGYTVEDCEDGRSALKKIEEWKPHLVLLDIVMPEMDGLEVLQKIRTQQTQVELPIILVTAMQGSEDVVRGFKLGANDYIPKNFNAEELFARVNTALQIRSYHNLLKQRNNTIERELDTARLIQKKLLPGNSPIIAGYSVYSLYVPMDKIGGDYYDYNHMKDYCDFFMADVSGHGVPGAFLASVLKMATQYTHQFNYSPPEILRVMDQAVAERGALGMFATAAILRLFPETGTIQFSNAGHPPILVHRRPTNEFIELTTPGVPLGINYDLKKGTYVQGEFTLQKGDRMVLFTDGILETFNGKNESFEDVGWKQFLTYHKDKPNVSLSLRLIEELKQFSGKEIFEDDITWVVIDYDGT